MKVKKYIAMSIIALVLTACSGNTEQSLETSKEEIRTTLETTEETRKINVILKSDNMYEAYSDICKEKTGGMTWEKFNENLEKIANEDHSSEEIISEEEKLLKIYGEIKDAVVSEEIKWLESIGADNIEHISNTFFCTIDENTINQFDNGKCHYNIITTPKYLESLEGKGIEDYYGTYKCNGCVFMPGEVDYGPDDTSIGDILTISDSELLIEKDGKIISSIKEPFYSLETRKDTFKEGYGFKSYHFIEFSQELYELFLGEHLIINVSGKNKALRIIIGGDAIYLDRGMDGVYKYK